MFALTYGDHFYTTSIAESNNAVAQDGYHFEGTACYVYDSQQPGTVPFFRLLNDSDGDHFYTASIAESNNAVAQDGYHFEGTACYVYDSQQPGTVPFFRLLDDSDGDHFYTASIAESNNAVAQDGYHFEGTACYVYDSQQPGTAPFFRLLKDPPSLLDESESMGPGKHIVSPNGTCWATLNSSPDYFYVYRGRYPDESGGVIWSLPTPVVGGGGTTDGTYPALFLVMQSDGNLVLYSGGPKNAAVWASNTVRNEAPHRYTASLLDSGQVALTNQALSAVPYWTSQADPVADFEIASIEYHLDQAQITAVDDVAAWTEELNNDTGIQQSITYTHTAQVTNTSGWQDRVAIHVGVSSSFKCKIPVAAARGDTVCRCYDYLYLEWVYFLHNDRHRY